MNSAMRRLHSSAGAVACLPPVPRPANPVLLGGPGYANDCPVILTCCPGHGEDERRAQECKEARRKEL